MAIFTRTFELIFNAEIIADAIEDYNNEEKDYYEHNTSLVPIIDFADENEDGDYFCSDFELTKEEEAVIIKEVTEELKKRGWK